MTNNDSLMDWLFTWLLLLEIMIEARYNNNFIFLSKLTEFLCDTTQFFKDKEKIIKIYNKSKDKHELMRK